MKSAKEIGLERAEKIIKEIPKEELKKYNEKNYAKSLVQEFFANTNDIKSLLQKVKNNEEIIKMVQILLIESLHFEKEDKNVHKAILELEKLKKSSNYEKYSILESFLNDTIKQIKKE
jgi:hypothetical protein